MGVTRWLAPVWGFAEATLFFIVPDALLAWTAIRHGWRPAALAALLATVGAVSGGALMYAWGATDAAPARAALDAVPAISPSLVAEARAALAANGLAAIFAGAFTGVPYKIYSVEAGAATLHPVAFLMASALARLTRFLAACMLASALARGLSQRFGLAALPWLFAGFWTIFYSVYFVLMADWVPRGATIRLQPIVMSSSSELMLLATR